MASSTSSATTILDHLVHLTPPNSLDQTIADFEALGFTVINGGTHADGLTSNALILLADGVYIELIFFNTTQPPPSHPWGRRAYGWIDAAGLGTHETLYSDINERYGGGKALYNAPKAGGRKTVPSDPNDAPKELKWRVTQPNAHEAAGELPFFCEDLTPREWRVPATVENTTHRNQVRGISNLTYITPAANLSKFLEQLVAVFGSEPESVGEGFRWTLTSPRPVSPKPTTIVLRQNSPNDEHERIRGTGLYELSLWTDAKGEETEVDSKLGRIRLVPLEK